MEQKEDHHQPTEAFLGSFRFRRLSRRRSLALPGVERSSVLNEGTGNRIPENDEDNNSSVKKQRWMRTRVPLQEIGDENVDSIAEPNEKLGFLGSQSVEKQHVRKSFASMRNSHSRRSCVPRFGNTESVPTGGVSTVAQGDGSEEKLTSVSSVTWNQVHSKNIPEEPVASDFTSRIRSLRERRRSRSMRQSGASPTKPRGNINEDCSENVEKIENEREGILGDRERRADLVSSHLSGSRIEMDTEEEVVGKKSERKSHNVTQENRLYAVGNSVHRSHLSRQKTHFSSGRNAQQEDPPATSSTVLEKDCRRVLEFSSGDEGEAVEDLTTPMTFLAETPIINRASVLQNAIGQRPEKEVSEPVIKKSFFDVCSNPSRFKRRSIRVSQVIVDNSGQSQQSKETKVSKDDMISNKSDSSSLPVKGKEPKTIDYPISTLENIKSKKPPTPQEASTSNYKSLSSEKEHKGFAHPGTIKRVPRRRSAAVLCVRTPMKRKSLGTEARSTSKSGGGSASSEKPSSQKCTRLRRSFTFSRKFPSLAQPGDKMAASKECLGVEKKVENNVSPYKCHKVDASTNTMINLAKIKLVDLKVLEDIEDILKEQQELNAKAALMQEKTTARRLEMKEKRLMESFSTSVSPLRRLKALFSGNHVDKCEVQEGPQLCEIEGEGGGDGAGATLRDTDVALKQNEMEWESPKAPLNLRDHQIRWRRQQQGNRLTRRYMEPSIDEEQFSDVCQGSTSPFTILVGDCERPSLAPMTPHSRHHVSVLKLNLKEQLEQLYNN